MSVSLILGQLALAAALLAGGCAAAQEAPRSAVRYEAPTDGEISARYTCRGAPVRLGLRTTQTGAEITAYEVNGQTLPAADLARWNAGLETIADFSNYAFSCRGGAFQAVSIRGRAADLSAVTVVAEWRQGHLYVNPPTPTP